MPAPACRGSPTFIKPKDQIRVPAATAYTFDTLLDPVNPVKSTLLWAAALKS